MKRFSLFLITLLSILIMACNSNIEDSPTAETETVKTGIRFVLGSSSERTVISKDVAAGVTSTYEIFIFNSTYKYESSIKTDSTLETKAGTYDVVLLARGDALSLLGTAYSEGVVVSEGSITNVTLTVLPLDITFDFPTTISPSKTFSVVYTVNFRNPFIKYSGSATNNYFLKLSAHKGTSSSSDNNTSSIFTGNSSAVSQSSTTVTYTCNYTSTSTIPTEDTDYLIKIDTEQPLIYNYLDIEDTKYSYNKTLNYNYVKSICSYSCKPIDNISRAQTTLLYPSSVTGLCGTIVWAD